MKLFKQKIIRYYDAGGKRCTSTTLGAIRKEAVSSYWYGEYTDADQKRKRVRLARDKSVAERKLKKLEGDAELAKVGLVDPYKAHRNRLLTEHLADYLAYLRDKKRDDEYVKKTGEYCTAAITGCGFTKMTDIRESTLLRYLGKLQEKSAVPSLDKEHYTTREVAELFQRSIKHVLRLTKQGQLPSRGKAQGSGPRKLYHRDDIRVCWEKANQGIGPTTANHTISAMKRLTSWLVKDRRSDVDYLRHLDRLNSKKDLRHRRRTLPLDQFQQFLDATISGSPIRGLSGRDRYFLYLLGAYTGFRASELASLTPKSFEFGGDFPVVVVAAEHSKHAKEDHQPLHPEIAAAMRTYLRDKSPDERLWSGNWTKVGAEMIRIDLAGAGIPYQDDRGHVFDFHALRRQFVSMMVKSGVEPKSAQLLARHSVITLTLDLYTDPEMIRAAEALNKLPVIQARGIPVIEKGGEAA